MDKDVKIPETIPSKDVEIIVDIARERLIKEIYKGIKQLQESGGYVSTQKAVDVVKSVRKKRDICSIISNEGKKTSYIDSDVIVVMLNGLLQKLLDKYPEQNENKEQLTKEG